MGGTTSVVSRLAFLPPKRGPWHEGLKSRYRNELYFVEKQLNGGKSTAMTITSSDIVSEDRDRPPRSAALMISDVDTASEFRTPATAAPSAPISTGIESSDMMASMGPASSSSALSADSSTAVLTPLTSTTAADTSISVTSGRSSKKKKKSGKLVKPPPTSVRLSILFFRCLDQTSDDRSKRRKDDGSSAAKKTTLSSGMSSSSSVTTTDMAAAFASSGTSDGLLGESDGQTSSNDSSSSHGIDTSNNLTILYSHGNAEDLATSAEAFSTLSRMLRVNVCAYDYEGYGLSEPRSKDFYPTEKSALNDVRTVFNWLIQVQKIPKERIIVFGRSLGSGPTVDLASKTENLAGCILQSPLRSAVKTQISGWMASGLGSFDIFKNDSKIDKIKSYPLMVIHGKIDKVVPFEHGEWLADKANEKGNAKYVERYYVDGCGHNDIEYSEGEMYYFRIKQFIDNHIRKPLDGSVDEEEKKEDE